MTIALYCWLAFAVWTLGLLAFTVGVYRWNLILRGARDIHTFRADASEDSPDWYRRATRAHLNCVENLPVFGAIVAVATFARVSSLAFDVLACTVVVARVAQSLTHVSFPISARSVAVRFTFFSIQLVCMIAQAWLIV
jgi:uncharacterized membrane protein YecN with MAPEG domain